LILGLVPLGLELVHGTDLHPTRDILCPPRTLHFDRCSRQTERARLDKTLISPCS
jgi:hypothetical protein